jgi:GNAT superfamily N-acetyltransferase
MSDKQIDGYVNNYIKIADLNLVSSVFDENTGEMVAIGVTFPSFTKALQHTRDGRMLPLGWWELLKVLKWHKTDTVDLLLIGVLPEYRKKGANSLIFNDLIKQFVKYGFKWAEAMPQMEDNKAVQSEWQYLESRQHRRHRCYTKKL